jgi:cell division protease FtsH
MVAIYGLNDKVGNVSFHGMSQDQFQKPYSDQTAKLIDDEVRKMIDEQYLRAQEVLKLHRKELNILAKALLEREVILKSDVIKLIGNRPFQEPQAHLRPEDISASDAEEPSPPVTGDEIEAETVSAE